MTKIIFVTFLALVVIAYCSANSVGSQSDEVPIVEGEEMMDLPSFKGCNKKWIPSVARNASCSRWCKKEQKMSGGSCEGKDCVCKNAN
ncbi:CLUMA_CG007765, isoform A [Clunio marinus]|uniref:CLUMA_CG007765, isoform A n=1 Tax=Clunio marinus TaxID=568069 RepID=A0A1J1I398_9DIPT|nr:CLUMA_CG007765, isoform A [Clunio marinus]